MPANLTPEYKKAEEAFRQAKTVEEKIACLERMLAVIPKHKGTDHMQGDLKKRLSKLRDADDRTGGKRTDPYAIKVEGAGRAVIVGPPNTGKSSLLAALTNAKPEIADFPFSSTRPMPGMMPFEDIQIQLIDTPPVTSDRVETYHSNLSRAADLLLCVVDISAADPVAQLVETEAIFENIRIKFSAVKPDTPQLMGMAEKLTFVAVNKTDADEDDILLGEFARAARTELRIFPVSAANGAGLEELKREIFKALGVLRVYSKVPGKKADLRAPFVLPVGSSVMDVARMVHNDFADNLKFARIWGSQKFEGQKVQRDYIVQDKDIIEFHSD